AEIGAVRPSNMPRKPPSTSPRSHLFIAVARLQQTSLPSHYRRRAVPLNNSLKNRSGAGEQKEQDAHDQVRADQGDHGPVLVRQAQRGSDQPLRVGTNAALGQEIADLPGEVRDTAVAPWALHGQRPQTHRLQWARD